jgi:hypothetical protein
MRSIYKSYIFATVSSLIHITRATPDSCTEGIYTTGNNTCSYFDDIPAIAAYNVETDFVDNMLTVTVEPRYLRYPDGEDISAPQEFGFFNTSSGEIYCSNLQKPSYWTQLDESDITCSTKYQFDVDANKINECGFELNSNGDDTMKWLSSSLAYKIYPECNNLTNSADTIVPYLEIYALNITYDATVYEDVDVDFVSPIIPVEIKLSFDTRTSLNTEADIDSPIAYDIAVGTEIFLNTKLTHNSGNPLWDISFKKVVVTTSKFINELITHDHEGDVGFIRTIIDDPHTPHERSVTFVTEEPNDHYRESVSFRSPSCIEYPCNLYIHSWEAIDIVTNPMLMGAHHSTSDTHIKRRSIIPFRIFNDDIRGIFAGMHDGRESQNRYSNTDISYFYVISISVLCLSISVLFLVSMVVVYYKMKDTSNTIPHYRSI